MSDEEQLHPPSHQELGIIDSGGVDEISVIPWSRLLRRTVTRRVSMTHRKATLLVLLASVFTVSFTITLLVVSLKTVADDVGTSVSVMSWVITGPLLAFGVVGPAFGKAGDLWGHKRLFVFGLVGAAIFALGSAFAWNALSLIILRTLSAASGSATGPAAMAYINRLFDDDERVRPLGVWSFVTAGAPVIGVVAMVILTTIDVGVSDWVIIAGLGLTGFGMGIAAPSLMALLSASVETANMGVASAMQQLMSQMGAVLGGALMIAVHDITESSGAVQSYSYGLYVGVIAAVGAVITARMVRSPRA
ncbi:MAG: MFS transporter [Actinobacteria bacterium]|nr:MFS transporter [Actinomycetota bacterium]